MGLMGPMRIMGLIINMGVRFLTLPTLPHMYPSAFTISVKKYELNNYFCSELGASLERPWRGLGAALEKPPQNQAFGPNFGFLPVCN